LLTEQPRHPYEIQRLIVERHKDFAVGKPRALYHAVDLLVRAGAIEPVETSREGRRPERTVYRITEEGCEEFFAWLRELLEHPAIEFPVFTAAVSFLAYLPVETATRALQGRIVELTSQIAALDGGLRVLLDRWQMPRLWLLEQELTRALRQAELDWVQALLDDLKNGTLTWDFPKE
jgi:DNA-binding PadR family transcriptional regulator